MKQADIGVIGLAVMGENLILNMESKGFAVSVFNRTTDKVDAFIEGRAKGKNIQGFHTLPDFVKSLATPRKVMMMVKAGSPVDALIEQLLPLLEKDDIVIDGGNSHFPDTIRRTEYVESKGLLYVGTGVSGGEEGALKGPSVMPGGSQKAWPFVKPIFQAIAAQVDGKPCCEWVGSGGAGHFVKMVHNGIEYGDMQIICEAYHIMKELLGMTAPEMADVFADWNEGDLDSYLIEITRDILRVKDTDGDPLVDKILDKAGQKGTGKWTAISALDLGIPLTLIGEAVFARTLSSQKEERVAASKIFTPTKPSYTGDKKAFIAGLKDALLAAKIVSYAQGFALMQAAAKEHNWDLHYGDIALMWRGGCIIRSVFLGRIKEAFDSDSSLQNIMTAPFFKKKLEAGEKLWRMVVSTSVLNGIPIPTLGAALSYFDGYQTARLPANLLQAQRDYFGAHTYQRLDDPSGTYHHTNWTGRGGDTASSTYTV